jgi:hypothetical protein
MFQQEFILMDASLNQTFTPIKAVSAVKGCPAVRVQNRNVKCLAPEVDGEFLSLIAVIILMLPGICTRQRVLGKSKITYSAQHELVAIDKEGWQIWGWRLCELLA